MNKIARKKKDRDQLAARRWETDLDRTLEQLDGEKWGEPTYGSYVVTTCHALRLKPIRTLTDEELRLAIGQQIGLDWLVRLAIKRLSVDPLRSGDFYEGDLLEKVLKLPAAFWSPHHSEHQAVLAILKDVQHDQRWPEVIREVREAAARFS